MGLIVFRQMGTLHALLPLVSRLASSGQDSVQLLGWDHLISKETADSFNIKLFKDLSRFTELVSKKSKFLLTGTSEKGFEDSQLWQWAAQSHVPSFAFVDQWSNIPLRFHNIIQAPDHILVIDEWCAKEVEKLGLASKTHVVGTPLWDALSSVTRRPKAEGTCEAVFITEPVSVRPLQEHIEMHGYEDLDSLKWAMSALEQWKRISGDKCTLKIKLHPRDTATRVTSWLEKQNHQLDVQLTDESKMATLETADFVFGDRSMFLVEAALVGLPVVSFQPHRKTTSPATDRPGIEVVTDEDGLMRALLKSKDNKPRLPAKMASETILELINREIS